MTILDAQLQFTGYPATTGIAVPGTNYDLPTTGAQNSSNIIDLHMLGIPKLAAGQGARDIGVGDDPAMKLLIQVVTAMVGGTSLIVALQGAPDDGTGNPGAWTTWWASAAVVTANLTQGARLYDMDMPRPPPGVGVPRFLQLSYTAAGTFTGGAIGAWIVLDRMDQMYNGTNNAVLGAYPPGIVVAN